MRENRRKPSNPNQHRQGPKMDHQSRTQDDDRPKQSEKEMLDILHKNRPKRKTANDDLDGQKQESMLEFFSKNRPKRPEKETLGPSSSTPERPISISTKTDAESSSNPVANLKKTLKGKSPMYANSNYGNLCKSSGKVNPSPPLSSSVQNVEPTQTTTETAKKTTVFDPHSFYSDVSEMYGKERNLVRPTERTTDEPTERTKTWHKPTEIGFTERNMKSKIDDKKNDLDSDPDVTISDTEDESSTDPKTKRLSVEKFLKKEFSWSQTEPNKASSTLDDSADYENITSMFADQTVQSLTSYIPDLLSSKTHSDLSENKNDVPTLEPMPFTNPNLSTSNAETSYDYINKISEPGIMVHSKYGVVRHRWRELELDYFPAAIGEKLSATVKTPKAIQKAIWPAFVRGHNVLAIGPPDCGKSIAILTALCTVVANAEEVPGNGGPLAIILCANSQMAARAHGVCKSLLSDMAIHKRDISVLGVDGSMNDFRNETSMKNGCDILITTPFIFGFLKRRLFKFLLNRLVCFAIEGADSFGENSLEVLAMQNQFQNAVKKRKHNSFLRVFAEARSWCAPMRILALNVANPAVCISSFHECALYGKIRLHVKFLKRERKIDSLCSTLTKKETDMNKIVIVCAEDDEVESIAESLRATSFHVIKALSSMDLEEHMKINGEWKSLCDRKKIILVCTDGSLCNLDIENAQRLVHFSLPQTFSLFSRRFGCIIDVIPNLWEASNSNMPIDTIIYIDKSVGQQLPKLVEFIKRWQVPFDERTEKFIDIQLQLLEEAKDKLATPLCNALLTYGRCTMSSYCDKRHTLSKPADELKSWIPTSGFVDFKLLHILDPTTFSTVLVDHVSVDNELNEFTKDYTTMSLRLLKYFQKEDNLKSIEPKVGDVCCVLSTPNVFERCEVVKIKRTKNKHVIVVNLIDKEQLFLCDRTQLYELPKQFKNVNTNVVRAKLVGITPSELCIKWNENSQNDLVRLLNEDGCLLKGKIVLGLNNCLWLESINCFQKLKSCNKWVAKLNLKTFILKHNLAAEDKNHSENLRNILLSFSFYVPIYKDVKPKMAIKPKVDVINPRWAHLEFENTNEVYVENLYTPELFYVRLRKFYCLVESLAKDLEKDVTDYKTDVRRVKTKHFEKGDYCIAKYTDSTFHRVRLETNESNGFHKCFFVDFGDWLDVESSDIFPMSANFIHKLPFQAIECRMAGIKSKASEWSKESADSFESFTRDRDDVMMVLFAVPFSAENAKHTDGSRYSVVLFHSSSANLNEHLVENEHAVLYEPEKEFLEKATSVFATYKTDSRSSDSEDDAEERISDNEDSTAKSDWVVANTFDNNNIASGFFDPERWDCCFDMEDYKVVEQKYAEANKPSGSMPDIVEVGEEVNESNVNEVFESPNPKNGRETHNYVPLPYKTPSVRWHEDSRMVHLKVDLVGVEDYALNIEITSIRFETVLRGDTYKFDIELTGGVIRNKCVHSTRGQYVYIKLAKLRPEMWYEVTHNKCKFISADPDFYDSSEEEDDYVVRKKKNKDVYDTLNEALNYNPSDNEEVDDDVPDVAL